MDFSINNFSITHECYFPVYRNDPQNDNCSEALDSLNQTLRTSAHEYIAMPSDLSVKIK